MTHQARFWLDALAGPSRGTCFSACRGQARFLASLLTFALIFAAGCNKKEPAPSKPHEKSAIIATQAAPGSAFIMSLAMDPAQPRFGRKTNFHVTVKQTLGTPVEGAQVEVSLVMPLMDMGKNQFPLKSAGSGEYESAGEFSMAGEWEVVVTASAEGKTGKTTFNVNVAE
ncbi:MAG: FixH family protein [Terriglobales bacterium]